MTVLELLLFHNIFTSSLNIHILICTNIYIEFRSLKGMEHQTLNPRKLLLFSLNSCMSFLSSHMLQSYLLIQVLILYSYMSNHVSQSAMLLVVRSVLTFPTHSMKGTGGRISYEFSAFPSFCSRVTVGNKKKTIHIIFSYTMIFSDFF